MIMRRPCPSQATLDLIDIFTPFVTFEDVPAHNHLYYCVKGINMCYILRSGLVQVRRDADAFVISSVLMPNIFGISDMPDYTDLYLETLSDSKIAILTTEHAHRLIKQNNAWEQLAGHVTKVTTMLFNNSVIISAPKNFDVLRFHLMSLMLEPADLRETTSAAKYIMERTRLSRSTVMKMLSQLKQGRYIEMEQGMLKNIHHLPEKY